MVVIVAVNVWQSVGRGCLFYWFQNQRIKIHKKEEDKRKARKRSSLAVENPKGIASVICLSLVGRGVLGVHQVMVNMSQRSMECYRSIMSI